MSARMSESRPPSRRAPRTAIGTETILVVEDDEALRSYTVETLAELGYRAGRHERRRAIDILDSGADIDLLYRRGDAWRPQRRQLADEAVATAGSESPVHHRLHPQRHRASWPSDPGVEMIGKPFSSDELTRKVRAILDGSAESHCAERNVGRRAHHSARANRRTPRTARSRRPKTAGTLENLITHFTREGRQTARSTG